jgi:hypothetical protein
MASGYIYIIWTREFYDKEEHVYKIGQTGDIINRLRHYPKGSRLMYSNCVSNHAEVERMIMRRLSREPHIQQCTRYGTEYYRPKGGYKDLHEVVSIVIAQSLAADTASRKCISSIGESSIDHDDNYDVDMEDDERSTSCNKLNRQDQLMRAVAQTQKIDVTALVSLTEHDQQFHAKLLQHFTQKILNRVKDDIMTASNNIKHDVIAAVSDTTAKLQQHAGMVFTLQPPIVPLMQQTVPEHVAIKEETKVVRKNVECALGCGATFTTTRSMRAHVRHPTRCPRKSASDDDNATTEDDGTVTE